MKVKRGLTFMISIGEYAGFYVRLNKYHFIICLGYTSFTITFYDFEATMMDKIIKFN